MLPYIGFKAPLTISLLYRLFLSILFIFPVGFAVSAQQADSVSGWRYFVSTSAVLSFSGINSNITAEIGKGRHFYYIGPKISLADQYLPSTAPLGFVTGYRFVFLKERRPGTFNFFFNLDYQLQYHKAFRSSANLPKRYNALHELNAGYGLQYHISKRFTIANVLGYGRYLEVFKNPKTNSSIKFDGYNRMLKVQLIYNLN